MSVEEQREGGRRKEEERRGGEREREGQLWRIRGSWDHGGKLAASKRKWRPLTSAKEWQFRDRKNGQTDLEGYLFIVRAAAKVMKFCSSTSLDTAQVITVCCCLSGDTQQWTGCFRVFDTPAQWGWPARSSETWNIPSLSPPVNVLHTGTGFIFHSTENSWKYHWLLTILYNTVRKKLSKKNRKEKLLKAA